MRRAGEPSDLRQRAERVLAQNGERGWTIPAPGVYPHQWLWDSCFVAIGLARTDPVRAAGELRALLRGQWSNGMVPHMVFGPGRSDVVGRYLWASRRDPRAPRAVDTSCVTQPPVLAVASQAVARRLGAADRTAFLAEVVPRIVDHHRWLYRERDLDGSGLVALVHPWECGLDTSPPWMRILAGADDRLVRILRALHVTSLGRRLRRDTRFIPAGERSSDDDGLRMLALAVRLRRHRFDARALPETCPLVHDVSFNAVLATAGPILAELAAEAGLPVDDELAERSAATRTALERLWSEADGAYLAGDARTVELVGPPTVASFVALGASDRQDRVDRLRRSLAEPRWSPAFPIPSVPIDADAFEPRRYWKGPTWVNTNWLVVQALRAVGADQDAEALAARTLELVARSGFAEYFSSLDGSPLGADDFSWTAALVLDLLGD